MAERSQDIILYLLLARLQPLQLRQRIFRSQATAREIQNGRWRGEPDRIARQGRNWTGTNGNQLNRLGRTDLPERMAIIDGCISIPGSLILQALEKYGPAYQATLFYSGNTLDKKAGSATSQSGDKNQVSNPFGTVTVSCVNSSAKVAFLVNLRGGGPSEAVWMCKKICISTIFLKKYGPVYLRTPVFLQKFAPAYLRTCLSA